MSKESDLRAMREARYSERRSGSEARPAPVIPAVRPAKAEQPPTDGLCGHRSMNGRSCTREQGHQAKSHRYS